MSSLTSAAPVELTPYEYEQVQRIAAWKSAPPNAFAEVFKRLTLTVTDLIEKVIPDRLVVIAIEKSYRTADFLAGQEDIKRQAGVHELKELKKKPLEECDRLALQVSAAAMAWATIEGAATGAGGVLTTLIDVPLLFILSLRTILRVGHCYGYPLDHERDQRLVLGILIAATSGSLVTKRQRLDQLREIEHLLVEEVQEDILADEALSFLFQLEIFEELPGIGTISGALLNLAFIRRVEVTARHVFQERWLLANGKVRAIEPALVHERQLVHGWQGALGRAAYASVYSLGFGVALPVCLVASLVRSVDHAIVLVHDGAGGVPGEPSRSAPGQPPLTTRGLAF